MKITRKILTLALVSCLTTVLSGCGQKGPLVLPDKTPQKLPKNKPNISSNKGINNQGKAATTDKVT